MPAANTKKSAPEPLDAPKGRTKRNRQRRASIVASLRRLIVEKGYANASITDLAAGADMSVSHLLYYYAEKDEVLLDLANDLHERILNAISAYRDEPPEERIHLLVDNLFVAISPDESILLREIIAIAAHSPALQANLEEFAGKILEYLEDLFDSVPRQPGMSSRDSAEFASALWMGLVINTAFESRLHENQARRLFRQGLLALGNIGALNTPILPVSKSLADRPAGSDPKG